MTTQNEWICCPNRLFAPKISGAPRCLFGGATRQLSAHLDNRLRTLRNVLYLNELCRVSDFYRFVEFDRTECLTTDFSKTSGRQERLTSVQCFILRGVVACWRPRSAIRHDLPRGRGRLIYPNKHQTPAVRTLSVRNFRDEKPKTTFLQLDPAATRYCDGSYVALCHARPGSGTGRRRRLRWATSIPRRVL